MPIALHLAHLCAPTSIIIAALLYSPVPRHVFGDRFHPSVFQLPEMPIEEFVATKRRTPSANGVTRRENVMK